MTIAWLGLVLGSLPQSEAVAREMDALLRTYAGTGWSGSVLVARGDRPLLATGYGFADFGADRPNDAGTGFEIASLTKSFTAAAILKLEQQGKLDLDDSIAVHLPAVPVHSRAITLRHLLAHTSGIPRTQAGGQGEDLALAVVAYLGPGPLRKPGASFEYWNGGYALLAGVIERASGRSYAQFCREELFAPARMGDTGFTGDADDGRAAIGTPGEGRPRSAHEHPYGSYGYQYRGMGGIVTTAIDLLKWDRALAGDALLDADHRGALWSPGEGGYALGWFVGRGASGRPAQSHGGAVRGFRAEFRRFPEDDACLAVLANCESADPVEIADNLECLLFDRPIAHPLGSREPLDAEEARACAGAYAGAAGRLVVRAAPGVLVAGIEGEELLRRLGLGTKPDWKADLDLLGRRAAEIVDGIASGDTQPLRTHMAKRIPASWSDTMRSRIWPAHLARHGAFRGLRPLGAIATSREVQVLLALDHEREPGRALVAFGPAGLERLDWEGPDFLVTSRLERVRAGVFRLASGEDAAKLEFDPGPPARLRVAGLVLARE
jgi:CubicO group peptidase (beta-lactamase class C family)